MYNNILVEIKNKIATITLNRPETGNAFAKESYLEIRHAVEEAEQNPLVSVLVITGKGRHFSSGGDIKRFKGLIESKTYLEPANIENAGRMAMSIRQCSKPSIAMINGAAAGAGCSLALSCDFRVMEPSGKLVMAFIKLGLSGDTCGMYLLQRLAGVAKTAEIMMLGDPLNGQDALAAGLVTVLAEEGALEEETMRLARKLAAGPTQAYARQKELMNEFFFSDMERYMFQEGVFMAECSRTGDFAEAVDAFLEKRQPSFNGK